MPKCHSHVQGIAGCGDYTDDGRPTETDAGEIEEAKIEFVGAAAGLGKDFGVVGGDVGGDLFLNLFELSRSAGMGDHFVVGVLRRSVSV